MDDGFTRKAARHPALLCTVLLLIGMGCAKRPVDLEREYAKTLAPKRLEPAPPPEPTSAPRRVLRVRVYADVDYRAQVLHWERGIASQLQRASDVVREPLGVVFELESTRPWQRTGREDSLGAPLTQLEALDPGEDVDLVIGLVSALPAFTTSHHQLGYARIFGRHCVLRGMENPEEHQQLMALFTHLPAAERDTLYKERKLHKETSVLLHEWAHTLGAFHVGDSRWMMSSTYDVSQAAFAPQTVQLLATSLGHLPGGRRELAAQQAWARELKALLASTDWPAWDGPDKDYVASWAERVLASTALLAPDGTEPPLPPVDRQRFSEVLSLEKQGRVEMAAQAMEPLAERHPRHEQVQTLACYLAVRTAPALPSTRERCEAADTRFPTQPALPMNLALLHLQAGRHAEAQAALLKARERVEAQAAQDAGVWGDLAGLFQGASCVTWAEQAAARAPGTEAAGRVLAWASRTRRWVGLPADLERTGVAPEREGELVRSVRDIEDRLHRGELEKGRVGIATLARAFPRAPSVSVVQCELHLLSGRLGPARTACQKALAAYEESVQAHLLLGVLAANTRAGKEARAHLERAIALEPAQEDAWRMLARQYRAAGRSEDLRGLKERYRARFSRDLP